MHYTPCSYSVNPATGTAFLDKLLAGLNLAENEDAGVHHSASALNGEIEELETALDLAAVPYKREFMDSDDNFVSSKVSYSFDNGAIIDESPMITAQDALTAFKKGDNAFFEQLDKQINNHTALDLRLYSEPTSINQFLANLIENDPKLNLSTIDLVAQLYIGLTEDHLDKFNTVEAVSFQGEEITLNELLGVSEGSSKENWQSALVYYFESQNIDGSELADSFDVLPPALSQSQRHL